MPNRVFLAMLMSAALAFSMCPISASAATSSKEVFAVGLTLCSLQKPAVKSKVISAKNKRARAAYKKKLSWVKKRSNGVMPEYAFVDLTGDGIDEMVVRYWPSIFTYRSGRVEKAFWSWNGLNSITKAYRSKKVVYCQQPDHMGSKIKSYLKWNGRKFVLAVQLHTPSKAGWGYYGGASYWVKGNAVSKKTANAYVKKLVGSSKAATVKY